MLYKFTNVIWVVLIILVGSSCSRISDISDTVVNSVPLVNYLVGSGYCTIKIKSSKSTNEGAPFYLLVKSTDFPTFLSEDYEKVVHLLDNPILDQPCFETFCIVPGWDQRISVETPPDVRSIGVYFFFTHPGNIWKQIIELKEGCSSIKIVLEDNEIISIGY